MNSDSIKGQWDMLVGKAKRVWGELTDDEILKAEGSADKLYGLIEKKFGESKEKVKSKIDELKM